MGRVLSCCATEAPQQAEATVGASKPRRASVSKEALASRDKRDEAKDKEKGAATSRSNASSAKGRSGRSSISQKATGLSTATTTSRSTKDPKAGDSKVEAVGSKGPGGAKVEGKADKSRRSSTRAETPETQVEEVKAPPASAPPEAPPPDPAPAEAPAAEPAASAEPAAAETESKSSKTRRASAKAAKEASTQPPEIRAAVALDDATPSSVDFVLLRPLPYEPIPPDAGDNNKQRSFVFKGQLVVVPMLPLQSPREGSPKSAKAPKNEDVRQNKGWKMVKSKVVGGAMKAE